MKLTKQKYEFKIFNKKILCYVEDGVTKKYINQCINHLNSLPTETINKFLDSCIRFYEETKYYSYTNIDIPNNVSRKEILKYINPISIRIEKPINNGIGFALLFDCDWEKDNGFECIIIENSILYLGKEQNNLIWKKEFNNYKNYVNLNYSKSSSKKYNNKMLPMLVILFGYLIGCLGVVILCFCGNFIMGIILILVLSIIYIYLLYKYLFKIKKTFH